MQHFSQIVPRVCSTSVLFIIKELSYPTVRNNNIYILQLLLAGPLALQSMGKEASFTGHSVEGTLCSGRDFHHCVPGSKSPLSPKDRLQRSNDVPTSPGLPKQGNQEAQGNKHKGETASDIRNAGVFVAAGAQP